MKTLGKRETESFLTLMEVMKQHGRDGRYLKLTNRSYMPLSLEILGTYHNLGTFETPELLYVSMAHYGELNGDLMADPEMTFLVSIENKSVIPASWTNHYCGRCDEAVIFDDKGPARYVKRMQADITKFANMWMRNLKAQGFVIKAQNVDVEEETTV
jgi:hypothetical protein